MTNYRRQLDRLNAEVRDWDAPDPGDDLADLPDDVLLGLYLRAVEPVDDAPLPEDDATVALLDAAASLLPNDADLDATLAAAQVTPAARPRLAALLQARRTPTRPTTEGS